MPVVNLVKGQGQALFAPGNGPILIVNNDILNPVWIGPQKRITTADTLLGPQASIALTGDIQYYGSTVADVGVVAVATILGGAAYSPGPPVPSSAALIKQVPGSHDLFTFPSAGRIWNAALSLSLTSTAAYAVASTHLAASIEDNALNLVLDVVEAAVAGPSQATVSNAAVNFAEGLPVPRGFKATLNVPIAAADTSVTASAVLLYSVP